MGPDTLTTTRENQTFSSVTPPWEMVRAPIYESGACSFRVAGVRSVLGAVLRQLQSALLVFGKVVLGTISHPLGEKKSVRLAARQQTLFRRVSEMGIKPMNSDAWRAGAPPTGMCRYRRQLPRHAKFCGCLSSCSKKCWMEEKGGLCATSLPPVFHGSQLMVRRRWRNSWFSVFSQIASMLEEMTQTAIPRSAQATSRSIISS